MDSEFKKRLEAARTKFFQKGVERAKTCIPALEEVILQTAERGGRECSWITQDLKDLSRAELDGLRYALQVHFGQDVAVRVSDPSQDGRHELTARW